MQQFTPQAAVMLTIDLAQCLCEGAVLSVTGAPRFVDALLYLIFAVLAAQAANKERPSVQTVLIRIAISWVLAMSVLSRRALALAVKKKINKKEEEEKQYT